MRAIVLLVLVSNIALADDSDLRRCRAIADSAARLACYDALPLPAVGAKAAPRAPASAAGPSTPSQNPAQFGLEHQKQEDLLAAIESHIPGRFDGWRPDARFVFANGQVWQVVDGSSGTHWIENPKVRVRRGLLGAFYLEIEGTNRSPRVQRLK